MHHTPQTKLAQLRIELKRQEAEQLAKKRQQEAQKSAMWGKLLKSMQVQSSPEHSPQEAALLAAKAREQKLQDIMGAPPVPPPAPRGLLLLAIVCSASAPQFCTH